MRNKRGWIKIVEAAIALLLIAGTILMVVPRAEVTKSDKEQEIYNWETVSLREIELSESLRVDILNVMLTNETPSQEAPTSVLDKMEASLPNYLECKMRVCRVSDVCVLEDYVNKDVFVQVVTIAATSEQEVIYDPRKLKIFCWEI